MADGGLTHDARAAARLWAVQALYQMDIGKTPVEDIIREFSEHRLDTPLEDFDLPEADADHFADILRGVIDAQIPIDRQIDAQLADGWSLGRIDSTLRAILRCGVYELMRHRETPAPIIVSQYTDIAHAFFDGPEGGMSNAVLDRIGKAIAETPPTHAP